MKPVTCGLWRTLEAFLCGNVLFLGWEQFDIVVPLDDVRKERLYAVFQAVVLITLLVALAIDKYYPQMFPSFLVMNLMCYLAVISLRIAKTNVYFFYLVVMSVVAVVNVMMVILAGCEYTNNPLPAVALMSGGLISMLLPTIMRIILAPPTRWGLEIVKMRRVAAPLLITKCVLTVTIFVLKYHDGHLSVLFQSNMWNRYKEFLRFSQLGKVWRAPVPYLFSIWNSDPSLWETVANLAAMLALMVAFPPSSSSIQLPMSPAWVADINELEMWSLYAGVATGACLPLPDSCRYVVPLLIFTAYLMHCCCTMAFICFSSVPWINLYVVAYLCAATCGIYGYAINSTVVRFVVLYFTRCCEYAVSSTQCCTQTNNGKCICRNRPEFSICEPRVETLVEFGQRVRSEVNAKHKKEKEEEKKKEEEEKKEEKTGKKQELSDEEKKKIETEIKKEIDKPVNHIIWIPYPFDTFKEAECASLRCRCKKNGEQDASSGNNTKSCLKCTEKHKNNACPNKADATTAVAGAGAGSQGTQPQSQQPAPNVHKSPPGEGETNNCFCAKYHRKISCEDICEGCICKNQEGDEKKPAQPEQCAQLPLENAQHYLLANTYTSTCDWCDLTLYFEGTPIWRPGNLCCLPTPTSPPKPYKWRQYDKTKDKIYLGYSGTECSVCSLVEISKIDPVEDYLSEVDLHYNHFIIYKLTFGACCHASFYLRMDMVKRDRYPRSGVSKYPFKAREILYIYFTTAAVTKKELEGANSGATAAAPAPAPAAAAPAAEPEKKQPCIGNARRAFVYYRECNPEGGDTKCIVKGDSNTAKQSKHCKCASENQCDYGCCIKVTVTEDKSIRSLRDAQRMVVIVRFMLLFFLFVLGLRAIFYICRYNGVSNPFRFHVDVKKIWNSVYGPSWNDKMVAGLISGEAEVLRIRGHNTPEIMHKIIQPHWAFLKAPEMQALESLVKKAAHQLVSSNENLPQNVNYYSICTALLLETLKTCVSFKTEALESYFRHWETRWTKEMDHYYKSLQGVVQTYAFGLVVAHSFDSDVRVFKHGEGMSREVLSQKLAEIRQELDMHNDIESHEVTVATIRKDADPDRIPTIAERLRLVWDGRIKYILHLTNSDRAVYDWKGFLSTYYMLKRHFDVEDSLYLPAH